MELLSYFVMAAVGFWFGWLLRTIVIISRLSDDPDRSIEILKKIKALKEKSALEELPEMQAESIDGDELEIERVGDELYAYAKADGEFIAQAQTLEALLEKAHARFPNRTFFGTISNDNPAKDLVTKT